MSELIKSTSYDQHIIIRNMIEMHNNGKKLDVDITYSSGKFYGNFIDKESGSEYIIE